MGPGWFERQDSDFFCTLDWFENLALNGFEEGALSGDIRLLFGINTNLGVAICLPLRLGDKLTGLSNYYSSLYGPMQWERQGTDPPANSLDGFQGEAAQLFAALIRNQMAKQAELQLAPLDIGTRFASGFLGALRSNGFWTDRFFCFGNWFLQVEHRPFEMYRTSLPSALQHSIHRGHRRLSKQGDWSIHVQTQADAKLDASAADFISVYQQSWKQAEPREEFIPSLIKLAAQNQWLRLGILRLQGQPVAAQLWIVKNAKASIFKLAYVEGFERFSPGTVLTAHLMRHVIDVDKVGEVDYLTGDDAYKKDWMSQRRERWGLLALRVGTMYGLVRASGHFLGKALRSLRRQSSAGNSGA